MISFIVPAYNEEQELPRTIAAIRDAALTGTAQPYEIIVVDDASTDATAELAAEAGARVISINRRQIAAARNAGARAAQGDYLFFVDADTRINPKHIYEAIAALKAGYAGGSARCRRTASFRCGDASLCAHFAPFISRSSSARGRFFSQLAAISISSGSMSN